MLPEEEPARDKTFISLAGRFLHNVQVRGIESEGRSGQTVSDQVDPQQLDGDQSLGKTKSGSQENGHDFTNVRRDQIADKLLHVVVDSTTCYV